LLLVALALIPTWMGVQSGGYFTSTWALAAIILAVVALVGAASGAFGGVGSRAAILALVPFGAYAAWTFASILWSPNRGAAWQGSGLTVLYLLAAWLGAALVCAGASRRWAIIASVLGPATVAAFTLLSLSSHPESFFENGRLSGTVGYYNGEAAFLLVPFWTAIYLAGSRHVQPALRGALLAGAVLCVEAAVLAQSRGALVATAASLLVYFLVSGQRLRGLCALAPVAFSLILTFPELNAVYLAFEGQSNASTAVRDLASVVWPTVAGAGFYGALWGLADRRWSPPTTLVRAVGGIALAGIVVAGAAGAFAVAGRAGGPVELARHKWEAFKSNDRSGEERSRYLSASGQGRYYLWEVAWEDFVSHPVLGVGTSNFEATYYRQRAPGSPSPVRQPHMLALEVLSERGIVGGTLFFGFLSVCVVAGLRERLRRLSPEGKAEVGALAAAVAYWLVHSSAEWFWQLPAVTLPAMIYLALLASSGRELSESTLPGRSLWLVGALAAVLAALIPLYAADRFLTQSYETANPRAALTAVERAERLDPLDPLARRREAELSLRTGDRERAERALGEAVRLDPEHYAPYALLGAFYQEGGRPVKALELYQQALARNPNSTEMNRAAIRLVPRAPVDGASVRLMSGSSGHPRLHLAMADVSPESREDLRQAETIPAGRDGVLYAWSLNVGTAFSAPDPLDIAFADANGNIISIESARSEGAEIQPPRPYRLALQARRGSFERAEIHPGDRIVFAAENLREFPEE
jgi:tetratricopeptide (TPR) repeat protein